MLANALRDHVEVLRVQVDAAMLLDLEVDLGRKVADVGQELGQ